MSETAVFDVVGRQRLAQQRVLLEVDLADPQVVAGPPPRSDLGRLGSFRHQLVRERVLGGGGRMWGRGHNDSYCGSGAAGGAAMYASEDGKNRPV